MMRESTSMPLNHSDSTPLRGQKSDPTTDVLESNVSGCTTSRPTELLINQNAGPHGLARLALMLTMSPTSKSLSALEIKPTDESLSMAIESSDKDYGLYRSDTTQSHKQTPTVCMDSLLHFHAMSYAVQVSSSLSVVMYVLDCLGVITQKTIILWFIITRTSNLNILAIVEGRCHFWEKQKLPARY
jgi:hypothetical protein